jgi:hypothetical protein
MDGVQLTETPQSEFPNDERWQLVNRIAASPPFQRSARLRTFLLYVVEQSLAGNSHSLHEHDIGCAIFNREPGYNPVDDNIVRVHARSLRLRLDTYFQDFGKEEKLEIVIPKGTYVPAFHVRGAASPKPGEIKVEEDGGERGNTTSPLDLRIVETLAKSGGTSRLPWILCAVFALISAALGVRVWLLPAIPPNGLATRQNFPPRLLAAVMDPGRPTIVVAPDSGIPIYSDVFNRTVSLTDYLTAGFPGSLLPPETDPSTRKMFELMNHRAMVTFSTAVAMSKLVAAAERNGWKLHLRFAHHMNAREFDEGNFILIGNSAANPWSGLYESSLNFRTAWDPTAGRTIFRNQSPRAGEIPSYEAKRAGQQVIDSYAVLALIRRQTGERRSNMLILGGLDSESTEAATDFACEPNAGFSPFVNAGGPPFEVLLHLRSAGGAVSESKVVTSRP